MKHKYLLLFLGSLALSACTPTTSSSYSEFSYDPVSSGEHGYLFDMDEKYALNTSVKEFIATCGVIYDKEEIYDLYDLIGLNDFYINKVTVTTVEKDLHDYGDNGLTLDEGNIDRVDEYTITRDNATHSLSGTGTIALRDKDQDVNTQGTYSLTYDEGLFVATEVWDYDNDNFDLEKSYALNDTFVEKHLALIDAKTFFGRMIASSEANDTIFDPTDMTGIIKEQYSSIELNKTTLVENIRHDENYRIVLDKEGFVTNMFYSYTTYYGKSTASPILRQLSTNIMSEKI